MKRGFWSHVDKTETCWLWTGCRNNRGHSLAKWKGRSHGAHRVSWEIAHGNELSAGTYVFQRCGVRTCVRPEHLYLAERSDGTQSFEDRFWSKVRKGDGCWEWTAWINSNGYGEFTKDHKNLKASRVSWILTYGPIPDGLFVCHHCDNPPCVRPDHLFLGTPLDNMRDMIAKGRGAHQKRRAQIGVSA